MPLPDSPVARVPETQVFPIPISPLPRSQENQLRAHQWMEKLHDQLGLQHFLRDCHEVGPPGFAGGEQGGECRGAVGGRGRPVEVGREVMLTPCRQGEHAPSDQRACSGVPSPSLPTHAGTGEEGGAPGAPGNGASTLGSRGSARRAHLAPPRDEQRAAGEQGRRWSRGGGGKWPGRGCASAPERKLDPKIGQTEACIILLKVLWISGPER